MIFEDRIYQEDHIEAIIRELGLWRKVCAQLPTGGGKTVEFSKLSYRYNKVTGKSVMILVHREELLEQTRKTLAQMYGIRASLIIAGTNRIMQAPVYIGMAESVHRRQDILPNVGLVIIDECHNAVFNKLHAIFTEEYIVGFTATPKSSSKKQPLNKFYHSLVVGPSIKTLIGLGHLAQNITRSPEGIVDKAKLAISQTGEYDIQGMALEYSKSKYVINTFISYRKFAKGKKTIIFNVNIEHSKEVTEIFNISGVPCRHLDGEMKGEERSEIINWFRNTPGAVLCNVGVATMGFDVPDIECVIVNRATTSMPLWLQMCGRGARPCMVVNKEGEIEIVYKKESFTIIDMGANAITHGDWCDDRDWQRIFDEPEYIPSGGVAPTKTCPSCFGIVHAATVVCPLIHPDGQKCLYIFDRKRYEEDITLGKLIVLTKDIDIEALMLANQKKDNYFVFFQIGRDMLERFSKSEDQSTQTRDLLFEKYIELGKQWFSITFPTKEFDEQWHRKIAQENWKSYSRLLSKQEEVKNVEVRQEAII